jgi:hypothetical protein
MTAKYEVRLAREDSSYMRVSKRGDCSFTKKMADKVALEIKGYMIDKPKAWIEFKCVEVVKI